MSVRAQTAQKSQFVQRHSLIRFIARGTSVRGGSVGNQDDYLVEVTVRKSSPIVARLRHRYPSYKNEFSPAVLGFEGPVSMAVRREPDCDLTYRDFGSAWLSDSDGRRHLSPILNPLSTMPLPEIKGDQTIACYEVAEGKIRTIRK